MDIPRQINDDCTFQDQLRISSFAAKMAKVMRFKLTWLELTSSNLTKFGILGFEYGLSIVYGNKV
jgi:membrane-anchored protein YejM (alkaline phosphatase superfamily)